MTFPTVNVGTLYQLSYPPKQSANISQELKQKTYFYILFKTMWKQILQYLYLRKKDPDAPDNINVKFMHGMNRISIFMFLFALIVIVVRLFIKR